MRNFDYLKDIDVLRPLYNFCSEAEETQVTKPVTCGLNCRLALEWIVKAIYKLKQIEIGERTSLFELMTGEPFTEFIADDRLMMAAHHIRKVGNNAAHKGEVKLKDSFFALLNTYNLTAGVMLKLRVFSSIAPFNKDLVPQTPEIKVAAPSAPVEPCQELIDSIDKKAVAEPAPIELDLSVSEAETRKQFIDIMLAEAGWEVLDKDGAIIPGKACIEIEVESMPTDKGIGYADYVLFGADNKPLAIVEAKRTSISASAGKHQAELYADCIEKKYGLRPVIYYTNGYHTYIIDGLGYPPREVLGYHTEQDLRVLIQRRGRQRITDLKVNDNITNREYQKRAVKAICEHFNSNHRRGLLVLATGTGKTRISISLCDILMRNQWAKNILFLADRTALVNQAKRNYASLLKDTSVSVLSDKHKPDLNARIIFSTYQTMINYIDTETKEFSVGRFDLIVIDESHRSVFGKYMAILDYFDALIVGLTATPREDVDKNTYDLFELESGEPNAAYDLDEAVADGYLVNYHVVNRTTRILQQGIKYDNLSADEKKQIESVYKYESALEGLDGFTPRDIKNKEIFHYIFNQDTIDKVLADLMDNGLKIHSGDLIGKTIVFAYNHKHAELVVERFHALYPEYGSDFCTLIDNQVNYAQNLIDTFSERDTMPQIAVSVDMLDTGIDVPDIINLVFFKPVHSKIKFWQMIGRGTRLSPNLFGAGEDKTEFLIFDWCGNFEYFVKNPQGYEPTNSLSLTERIFGLRLDLACTLQHQRYQQDKFCKSLHDELKDILKDQVRNLNTTHASVRKNFAYVDKYQREKTWEYISSVDAMEMKDMVAPLLVKGTVNEAASKFDALLLQIQLSKVNSEVFSDTCKVKVIQIANALQEKGSIPQVHDKMELIIEVANIDWDNTSLSKLETIRKELRELMKFIDGTSNKTFTLNIADVLESKDPVGALKLTTSYRQRVIDYLAEHRDLPVLEKIFRLEQLQPSDIVELEKICWKELGTKQEYDAYISRNNMICGDKVAAFIRAQIGVDRTLAVEKFSEFISDNNLNSTQEEYLKTIISYVCENGDISPTILMNESPFSDFSWNDVFGENLIFVAKYVNEIHNVIA